MHIALDQFSRSRHQLAFCFRADDMRFSTTLWYGSADLVALESRFGRAIMEKIYFHIAASEMMALYSLAPRSADFGPLAGHHTPAFESLWRALFWKIWAQWRFENDRPDYRGPEIAMAADGVAVQPASRAGLPAPEVATLAFCGGGKDSLVTSKLLERAGVAHDAYLYSHSIYGKPDIQHRLIDDLLGHCAPVAVRRTWIQDEFSTAPVLALHPDIDVRTVTAAETPCSLFGALPLALEHDYRYFVVGHERSSDSGQMVWELTGEEINHQWGKSLEAELLLNSYVQSELLADLSYFSPLKPIYDILICNLLNDSLGAVKHTHSCNQQKPWCMRCPKCAYVWLQYMAWLPRPLVESMFDENPLDLADNQLIYRQLLGLEEHMPFECIGEVDEARLAFAACHHKGVTGQAMTMYLNEVGALDGREYNAMLERYTTVTLERAALPPPFAERIGPLLEAAAHATRARLAR
jgi:UDP-N-acetyl-alpha-D-muramoyl-L-alanyl-L-glutamate epimerase